MAYEKKPDEIGTLWLTTSAAGKVYYSGFLDGIGKVVGFPRTTSSGKQNITVMLERKREAPPQEEQQVEAPF